MTWERSLFVGGTWQEAADGAIHTVRDPATGEVVGRSAVAGAADVDRAVDAARSAGPAWAGSTPTSAPPCCSGRPS